MNRRFAVLMAFVFTLTMVFIFISIEGRHFTEMSQSSLGFLTGLFTMWFIHIANKWVQQSSRPHLEVDMQYVDVLLSRVEQKVPDSPKRPISIDTGARALVATDPSLALAQLRIQLERLLRDVSEAAGQFSTLRPVPAARMARELESAGILPRELGNPLQEVLRACNRAVHGFEVPPEEAEEVISIGERVAVLLRENRWSLIQGRQNDWAPKRGLISVYVSHARADDRYLDEFLAAMEGAGSERTISIWTDRNLLPGTMWRDELRMQLERAEIIVPLVTPAYLASDFAQFEVEFAEGRARDGRVRLVPVIVEPTDWLRHPLSQYQVLPTDGQPIAVVEDREQAWKMVAYALMDLAKLMVRGVEAGSKP